MIEEVSEASHTFQCQAAGSWQLIGRMPPDSWGKILQILLDGKTAACARDHADACECSESQKRILRVYGYGRACACKLWHSSAMESRV